ncbi:MAG: hypothetical protein E6I13_10540 [Chloroflexi bacterium]|nr:MAG: hypothetical protein E6I13_10540 [Chloroflexota bacterium]
MIGWSVDRGHPGPLIFEFISGLLGGIAGGCRRSDNNSDDSFGGSVVKRPKARIGDVFQIPLHPGQVGHGQVVAVNSGPGPLYVVIFRRAWPLDAQPDIRNIVADEIALVAPTMDALIWHGKWPLVGTRAGSSAISGLSHHGRSSRPLVHRDVRPRSTQAPQSRRARETNQPHQRCADSTSEGHQSYQRTRTVGPDVERADL